MDKKKALQDLFNEDFSVLIDYCAIDTEAVANLFKVAKDLGIEFEVDEGFEDTWMEGFGCSYEADNWGYFGILDGKTYVEDNRWGKVLSVQEFEEIVNGFTSLTPKEEIVISGGVVVVNYKNGQKYHLYHNGMATLNVKDKTVTTEHTFQKDGQEAYERVVVALDTLESVQSEANKLINVGNNQVAHVTLYTL